ncbi:MAG: hypothetical protein EOR22_23550 [Mesorhizobium sp.]|nr:MAG: hypothetical protein EOR22_23550 [Mesorhizobium sp.]
MKVLSNASIKPAAQTATGELISHGRRVRSLAIVLRSNEDGSRLVGELTATEEPHPRILYIGAAVECLSYGADWAIEPEEGDQAFPSLHEDARLAGLLALRPDGWFISFASSGVDGQGRFNLEWYRLEDGEALRDIGNAALFKTWRIWPTADGWSDGRDHLWEYTAKPPPRSQAF